MPKNQFVKPLTGFMIFTAWFLEEKDIPSFQPSSLFSQKKQAY